MKPLDISNILKLWKSLEDYKDIALIYECSSERIRQIVKDNATKEEYKMIKKLKSEYRRHKREVKSIDKYWRK